MLTREENELLTQVGPGTPGGELLRRYWLPVSVASELTEQNPTHSCQPKPDHTPDPAGIPVRVHRIARFRSAAAVHTTRRQRRRKRQSPV